MTHESSRLEKLLAAVGVIVSLLFVGYEIRQNTSVARAEAVVSISEQINQWQTEVSVDDDWIRIITDLRNGGSYGDLSLEDQQRYNWVVTVTVRIMETRFTQMQLGVVEPEDLGVHGGTSNTRWFRSPHLLEWWQSRDRSQIYSPEFLEFFETEVLGIR